MMTNAPPVLQVDDKRMLQAQDTSLLHALFGPQAGLTDTGCLQLGGEMAVVTHQLAEVKGYHSR